MSGKHAHCGWCGHPFGAEQAWPRTCASCGKMSFLNPAPVAVVLLPVGSGLLVVRRGINPGKGMLALPGGFIDIGESWQQACARELYEETHVAISAADVSEYRVRSAPDGSVVLIFGIAKGIATGDLPPFEATNETTERDVLSAPAELAFPLHTEVVSHYFASR